MTYREFLIKRENRKSVTWTTNLLSFSLLAQQILMFVISLLIEFALAITLGIIGKGGSINDVTKLLSDFSSLVGLGFQFVVYLPAMLIPPAFYIIGRKRPVKDIISFKRPKISQLLIAYFGTMAFGFIGIIITNVLLALLNGAGIEPMELPFNKAQSGVGPGIFFVFILAVMPALLEEFAYRGVLMGEMRRYNRWAAVLISGLFFGFMHCTVQQTPYAMFIGFAIAYFVIKFDSIWVGVFIHFINNGIAAVEAYLFKFFPDNTKTVEMGSSAFQILLLIIGVSILIPFIAVKGIDLPKKKGEISFKLAVKGIICSPVFYVALAAMLIMTAVTLIVPLFTK